MENLINKAKVLVEAMPYIQKFRNEIIVVKFGGSAMEDPELVKATMRDIVLMECIGMRPVVVHGGGKAISAELERKKIKVEFVNGLRRTCSETIKIVDHVLHQHINKSLIEHATSAGGKPQSISGKDILKAQKMTSQCPDTGKHLDIGYVGNIIDVDVDRIFEALESGLIPVIPPLGIGDDGKVYNINADIAACKIAEALKARKLIFLSDVPGVMRDPSDETSVIPSIRSDEVEKLIKEKVITGGMLPKIQSSLHALDAGTNKVHMIDGRTTHSLLLEIFTDKGVGTQIVRPDSIL
ncbi:MAG: acetylglutamate kinase [Lentisphaerae bacterium]|nr:acetylglutamate kinase [Lentisphaerota bacterium]MCP4101942.1 acetylglutamate kinase [Lentisphaerota bacterium]